MKDGSEVSLRIQHIVAAAGRRAEGKAPTALAFVELFCLSVPQEDLLSAYDVDAWAQIALEAFSFVETRKGTGPHVRARDLPCAAGDGSGEPRLALEILCDDSPFLVDSVSETLNRRRMHVYCLSHPVIATERDAGGKAHILYAPSDSAHDVPLESFQHYQLDPLQSDDERQALIDDVKHTLGAVREAVTHWQSIVERVRGVGEKLKIAAADHIANIPSSERPAYLHAAEEYGAFLEWLCAGNFIFLGYSAYDLRSGDAGVQYLPQRNGTIGALNRPTAVHPVTEIDLPFELPLFKDGELRVLGMNKANERSIVHRPVHMDYIAVRLFDADGNYTEEHRIVGMFTSIVYYQSAKFIPLIRRKIDVVENRAGFPAASHNAKEMRAMMEAFPRDELFQMTPGALYDMVIGMVGLSVQPRVRLFLRKDELERYVSCIVFLPRDRMSTELRYKIEHILCDALNGTVSTHYTQVSESHLARLQVIVKTAPGDIPSFDERELEAKIQSVTHNWSDNLNAALTASYGERASRALQEKYKKAFPEEYKARFSGEVATHDVAHIERLGAGDAPIIFSFGRTHVRQKETLQLKIYHREKQIFLSEIIPIVENMGLKTMDEFTYAVHPSRQDDTVWIHVLRFAEDACATTSFDTLKKNAEEALLRVWRGQSSNDSLNGAVIRSGLHWRDVQMLRSYAKYLKQARFNYSQAFIQETLAAYPDAPSLLTAFFHARFDPHFSGDRQTAQREAAEKYDAILGNASNLADERVLRTFIDMMRATLRTNYFRTDENGVSKDYMSFKISSSQIAFLPKPRPYAEIFVYASYMEGIHLRGGKVARGGLRWSDRHEDYRTEVLGLMKAQMTKNSVIIPVGSKGGFVVKHPPAERDAKLEEGKRCYRTLLRGLLDLTDNLSGGAVVPPPQVVRYDQDDPYLVVAADKGTATFSDIANGVSAEYKFWLGDAFASGGSAGYDHKKMGITAKGAWISVRRHFREAGVDSQHDPIRTIGIGDMSGDVFGNGLLMSRSVKLVAAFNHMHIFVDPNPDAEKSFVERERLFALPRSTWEDYDARLISDGGGVFSRAAKSVTLTPEMKKLTGRDEPRMTPDEFIHALLQSKVDLLWNGGIGTYIKSRSETNEECDDKANDSVRVNGADLRCKVVGEGGNLGATQLGRIEYALSGGRINTDAIDNSAGVDCSDHEVNIKILLNRAIESGTLSHDERNALLESMTDNVADLVLIDNLLQTQALTVAQMQAPYFLELFTRLIAFLETRYTLDRQVEFLPSKEEMSRRQYEGKSFTRPELSVIMAYCKLYIYETLLKSALPDDPYYEFDLIRYFPKALRERFAEEIKQHPLRREIIATVVTNSLINRLGVVYYFRLTEVTGAEAADVASAYIATRDIFELRSVWKDIENLGADVSANAKTTLFDSVGKLMQRSAHKLLRRHAKDPVGKVIEQYREGVRALKSALPNVLAPDALHEYNERRDSFLADKVPEKLATDVAAARSLLSAFDILAVSQAAGASENDVAAIYHRVGQDLQLRKMRHALVQKGIPSYWQQVSAYSLTEELYQEQERIARNAVIFFLSSPHKEPLAALDEWREAHVEEFGRYRRFLEEIKSQEDEITVPMIVVALQKLKEIAAEDLCVPSESKNRAAG
ncbi:MAG: NAD-glutamate dehydrogenase [Rickettsiales bacterium]